VTDARQARVTKRRPATRARLLDAATTVFAEHGFGSVSIEQIAAAAGYTRGAFYSNFASTEELFFALYQERSAVVAEQVAQALAKPGRTVAELIEQVLTALTVDRQWILVKTDFLLHAARNPEVASALAAHRDALRDVLATCLAAAVTVTALRPTLRYPHELARAVITVHDGAMLQLLVDPDQESLRRWLHDVLVALLDPRTGGQ
jgi:AcrR family transcriptional regulator